MKLLKEKITALMAQVGLKAKGIYQVDEGKRSKHTNAYFTGIGKTKRIVLYDTLSGFSFAGRNTGSARA